MKLVEIVNTDNFVKYLTLTAEVKDTIIIPPRGRLQKLLTDQEIEQLKVSKVQYRII